MGVRRVWELLEPVWVERIARWRRSPAVWVVCGLIVMLAAAIAITHGTELGASEAAEWFAAFASVFAVGVALQIATRDRRDRQQDAANAGRAQARLVHIATSWSAGSPHVVVDIVNYGQWAILNVMVNRATLHDGFRFNDLKGVDGPDTLIRIIPPVHQPSGQLNNRFALRFKDRETGVSWTHQHQARYTPDIDVVIEFLDAQGSWWITSSKHGPEPTSHRVTVKEPRPPLRQKLAGARGSAKVIRSALSQPDPNVDTSRS